MTSTLSPRTSEAWSPPAEPGWVGQPGHRRPQLTDRNVAIGVVILALAVGAFLAYMVASVPVLAPRLPRSAAVRHWNVAAWAAVVVLVVDAGVIAASHRRRLSTRRRQAAPDDHAAPGRNPASTAPRRRASRRLILTSALASILLFAAAVAARPPLWVLGAALLIPWLPLLIMEVVWMARREPVSAFFAAVVGFQILHMGEHGVQVGQLALYNGDLSRSHGVFGQLDFEVVHLVSDIAVWLALGLVIICLRNTRSPWLWIAFGAASAHAIEHLYLGWIYFQFRGFYTIGGFAGIMGSHGVIGSPMGRPYLHFGYNFVVVVPMVLALWDQRRRSLARDARAPSVALAS
jgi:hypothetical protein